MSQFDYIKNIAKYGLENDQDRLLTELNELIEYSKKTKKINFALQLQSILKEVIHQQKPNALTKVGSDTYYNRLDDRELNELILEKLTSDYRLGNLIAGEKVRDALQMFIKEHRMTEILRSFDLPVSNKLLLYGPSGCGKTLASYVIAGELGMTMAVVNLGAIVSSKLGETSKNLAKIFRNAAAENCIIFIDEFDSLGKVRDYSQDHGEMKRVVNTILQLFDYLPQSSVVIAATNQKDMLDEALVRRFDVSLKFDLPDIRQTKDLVSLVLRSGRFSFDSQRKAQAIIRTTTGLSYYSIQKTLVAAIKRSLFDVAATRATPIHAVINTEIWKILIEEEKVALQK